MSHSSNERIYLPDLFHLALYSFKKMNEILSQLNIHREHIQKKVQEHPETSQYYQQSAETNAWQRHQRPRRGQRRSQLFPPRQGAQQTEQTRPGQPARILANPLC